MNACASTTRTVQLVKYAVRRLCPGLTDKRQQINCKSLRISIILLINFIACSICILHASRHRAMRCMLVVYSMSQHRQYKSSFNFVRVGECPVSDSVWFLHASLVHSYVLVHSHTCTHSIQMSVFYPLLSVTSNQTEEY